MKLCAHGTPHPLALASPLGGWVLNLGASITGGLVRINQRHTEPNTLGIKEFSFV
jgi:hypothetical protein